MANANDLLNAAATFVSGRLQKDSDVKAKGYFTKTIEEEPNFKNTEIPAVSISCFSAEDTGGMTRIEGIVEIFCMYKRPEDTDKECKQIASQIYYSLKKKFIPGFSGRDFADIDSDAMEVLPAVFFDGLFSYGTVKFHLFAIV